MTTMYFSPNYESLTVRLTQADCKTETRHLPQSECPQGVGKSQRVKKDFFVEGNLSRCHISLLEMLKNDFLILQIKTLS